MAVAVVQLFDIEFARMLSRWPLKSVCWSHASFDLR